MPAAKNKFVILLLSDHFQGGFKRTSDHLSTSQGSLRDAHKSNQKRSHDRLYEYHVTNLTTLNLICYCTVRQSKDHAFFIYYLLLEIFLFGTETVEMLCSCRLRHSIVYSSNHQCTGTSFFLDETD